MKTYIADEGMIWKNGEELLGNILYTPDDFDGSNLEQTPRPVEEEQPVE